VQNDPRSRAMYMALRQRGHSRARALRSVGPALNVACAILRNGIQFNPSLESRKMLANSRKSPCFISSPFSPFSMAYRPLCSGCSKSFGSMLHQPTKQTWPNRRSSRRATKSERVRAAIAFRDSAVPKFRILLRCLSGYGMSRFWFVQSRGPECNSVRLRPRSR
jgi:hypothetical protein